MKHYKSLIFDCDGVVLDSNKVKTQAFYKAALAYGDDEAKKLLNYHQARGGVSRYVKFRWFLNEVVPGRTGPTYNELLSTYADEVISGLSSCSVVTGLKELRELTNSSKWFIVSGGDQTELRDVFTRRGLSSFFDGGIFGSPDTKAVILNREITNQNIQLPAIFFGDSRYDHEAAEEAGLDFIFMNYWTEFKEWKDYCRTHQIQVKSSLLSLVKN